LNKPIANANVSFFGGAMELTEYIRRFNRVDLEDFAHRCATTAGQIRQVSLGNRRAGESLAINIERESNGAVTCEVLRPDVDWAYIRSSRLSEKAA
jgi:DNA-binding transcriptional regulator YdaS (Cro superfamily)